MAIVPGSRLPGSYPVQTRAGSRASDLEAEYAARSAGRHGRYTMRAVMLQEYGGPEKLKFEDDILIRQSDANPRWGAPRILGGIAEDWNRSVSGDRGQINGPPPETSLPDMADFSQESHQGLGFHRFLRRAHHHVPAAVHFRDSQP
jgi:hypothetical protein